MRISALAGLTFAITSVGVFAMADGHITDKQIEAGIKARQAQMQLYSFQLSTLGGMAKGNVPYNAEAATGAANNLAALAMLSQAGYWLPGSDSGSIEKSRALPAIWAKGSDIGAKGQAFADAVTAMQSAAGTDLAGLRAAMGALGASCSGCHDDFRQPKN